MKAWIEQHRARMFVGKYTPRTSEPTPVPRTITAELIPLPAAENASSAAPDAPEDDGKSTLQRLEEAERGAYRRYIDSGGSERAAQVWLLVCDQKRKLIADQAKQTSDVSESETKFLATCAEIVLTLDFHLKSMPRLLGLLCENLERDAIEEKVADQIERTLTLAAMDLADQIRGTSLENLLPPEERDRRMPRFEEDYETETD
jgi:hypothetical protein